MLYCFCIHTGSANTKISVFGCQCEDRFILMKIKRWVHIMMFGVVTIDCDMMFPFIFPYSPRLNTKAYIKCLEKVVFPWIVKVASGRKFIWQQNSTPCHEIRKTQRWLSENFCYFFSPKIWLPISPYCNPLVWATVDRENKEILYNSKNELLTAFTNLKKETVGKASRRFWSLLETVVEASGNIFEWI